MFPTLHSDLLEGKTNTLEAFIVKWRHYEVPEHSCELEKLIIQKLCLSAAAVREYFPDGDLTDERATNISEEKKTGLPTNNLIPERDFSVFDRLSRIAKQRNRKFKATNIRNDMKMLGSRDIHVTPT